MDMQTLLSKARISQSALLSWVIASTHLQSQLQPAQLTDPKPIVFVGASIKAYSLAFWNTVRCELVICLIQLRIGN